MTDDDNPEWWHLSAAIAWIAVRQPLPWQDWPEHIAPPRFGPSGYLSDDVRLSEVIKRKLAEQDDGVDGALAEFATALKLAAAKGRVSLRGRGPWTLDPDRDAGTVSEAAADDARPTPIGPSEFERVALELLPGTEAIGPSDDAKDLRSFPRWKGVTVEASALRREWRVESEPPAFSSALRPEQAGPVRTETRRRGGLSYAADDAPLLDEMRRRIDSGEAGTVWAATLLVADRAAGGGTLASKRQRLHGAFQKRSA